MTTTKVQCDECGIVAMDSSGVTLLLSERAPQLNHVAFDCPTCSRHVRQEANKEMVAFLARSGYGFQVARWEPPLELDDPQRQYVMPITEDELIEFGLALEAAWDITAEVTR